MKVVILGPTGVGKTRLSIELAKWLNADVINCDAVQVYKGLDIGSAKVTKTEMEGIPHHLFDIRKPSEEYSVADYQQDARKLINNNKNHIIVGGTGLYATALFYDYRFSTDQKIDLSKYSNEELLKLALKKDSNCNIPLNNRIRLERFIKRQESGGSPVLLYNDVYFIGLTTSRENLYNIINKRVEEMLDKGLIEEVTNLYKLYPNSKILNRAIGYKEVIRYLNKEIGYEEMVKEIKKNSRHYAKRQYTWFNNKMDIKWFSVDYSNFEKTIKEIKEYLVTNITL